MSAASDASSLLKESNEGSAPVKDRLTTTLFLAALFHGIVILGVTFAIPPRGAQPTPTLEVLLVAGPDTNEADNPDARYLAQRNQRGTGTTDDEVRPANPASSLIPVQQEGVVDGTGNEYHEAVSGERSTEFVSARSNRNEVAYRSGEKRPAQEAEAPMALSQTAPTPIATNATDTSLRLRGRQDGKYEVLPNTRESIVAPYLDSWRRKIEKLGTLNFPQIARQDSITANPVLEVVIRSDGSLANIIVRRSSGRKEIDQAALSILRLASPFDPFPSDLQRKYDELRFAYEWQFLGGGGTVSVPADSGRGR